MQIHELESLGGSDQRPLTWEVRDVTIDLKSILIKTFWTKQNPTRIMVKSLVYNSHPSRFRQSWIPLDEIKPQVKTISQQKRLSS